jgi:hypothetical protein
MRIEARTKDRRRGLRPNLVGKHPKFATRLLPRLASRLRRMPNSLWTSLLRRGLRRRVRTLRWHARPVRTMILDVLEELSKRNMPLAPSMRAILYRHHGRNEILVNARRYVFLSWTSRALLLATLVIVFIGWLRLLVPVGEMADEILENELPAWPVFTVWPAGTILLFLVA